MSKSGRSKGKAAPRRKKTRLWQGLFAVVVLGGLASSWILMSRNPSSEPEKATARRTTAEREPIPPSLRNRMVLPARPQTPRPVIMDVSSNPNAEIRAAYQAARDAPEALENVACYCGCFANSGHRNNLDCFKDSHGLT